MKKLLIVNNNLQVGGVQRALVSLLWAMRGEYDITLLLFANRGPLCAELPPEIKVLEVRSLYHYFGLTRYDVAGKPGLWLPRAALAASARTVGQPWTARLCDLSQPKLRGWDVAIAFLHNGRPRQFYGGCNDFVLDCVEARRKVAFVHADFRECGGAHPANRRQYARFDAIAVVSEGCRDGFLAAFPELAVKTLVVRNSHRFDDLRARAAEAVELPGDRINVLTVARLAREKGVDRALRAVAALPAAFRSRLRYTVIGEGIERPALEKLVRALGLDKTVALLGELPNPYPYLRAADLLLIPSRHEAAPLVIDEAAAFGTPVLSTRTSSAEAMIARRGLGWVCENGETDLTEALASLLAAPERLAAKRGELAGLPFDNSAAHADFYRLMEACDA